MWVAHIAIQRSPLHAAPGCATVQSDETLHIVSYTYLPI
jgi:hypothetical protein